MIHKAQINNFRSLKNIQVDDLRRVNLVVGDNGAGKTALLEAMYVGSNEDALLAARRLDRLRGIPATAMLRTRKAEAERWDSLFYWGNAGEVISISLQGDFFTTTNLEIRRRFREAEVKLIDESIDIPQEEIELTIDESSQDKEILTRFTRTVNNKDYRVQPSIGAEGSPLASEIITSALTSVFYPATNLPSSVSNARLYSTLAKSGKEREFEKQFREQFPEIKELRVFAEGSNPELYARRFDDNRPVPLNLISAGMTRLAAYLLAIATTSGGTVLLDEVESGLYFERYALLWAQLHNFACAYNVQVFASSHSHECNRAAVKTMEEFPDDFALIRVGQRKGETQARVVPGSDAAGLINSGLEYR